MKAIVAVALCLIAGATAQYNYNMDAPVPNNYYMNQYQNDQYNQYYNQYDYQYNTQYKTGPTEAVADPRCPRTDDPMKPVHLPYAGNCAKFLKCTGGMGFVMDCPAGLDFSARMNRCDYPGVAQCRP